MHYNLRCTAYVILYSNNKIVNSNFYHPCKGSITKIDLKEDKTKNFRQIRISRRPNITLDDIQYLYFLSNWNFGKPEFCQFCFVNLECFLILSIWDVFSKCFFDFV